MNVFKYFPILLLIGTIALYCTGNYASEASSVKSSVKASTVTVKTLAIGKNRASALEKAEIKAFESLLFEGVPGSSQSFPLIGDEDRFKSEHTTYYSKLIREKGYKNFIQSLEIAYVKGLTGKKNVELALKVDLEALKMDLRKNNINSIEL